MILENRMEMMKSKIQQWICVVGRLVIGVVLVLLTQDVMAACNAPDGTEYDLSVSATADKTIVPVGATVNFSYTASTSDGLHLPPTSITWSPYLASQSFSAPGYYTNWITIANPSDDHDGPCAVSNSVVVTVLKVEIVVDLEDQEVNGARSGLKQDTLRFDLNGNMIPASNLTLQSTTVTVDGEQITSNLKVTYVPLCSELNLPGSNTVKVDIDDVVSKGASAIRCD